MQLKTDKIDLAEDEPKHHHTDAVSDPSGIRIKGTHPDDGDDAWIDSDTYVEF